MTQLMITIGPATSTEQSLGRMLALGVRAFRFPASKYAIPELTVRAETLAALARAQGVQVQLFVDLPGVKPRFGNTATLAFTEGQPLRFVFGPGPGPRPGPGPGPDDGDVRIEGMTGDEAGLEPGAVLVAGDGAKAFRVVDVEPGACRVVALAEGQLGRRRGVAIAGRPTPHAQLGERDRADLKAWRQTPFHGVIVSFVEEPQTLAEVRDLLTGAPGVKVVAKIETEAGSLRAQEIAAAADAVLLGRGDLLTDCGPVEFHACSRRVLAAAQASTRPSIVGTQVLASASTSFLPNRSELAYASQLVEDGVGALMLATETSVGRQPHRTVAILRDLIQRYGRLDDGLLVA